MCYTHKVVEFRQYRGKIPLSTPTRDDLIYAASVIDCEGCICIGKTCNKNRKGRPYPAYTIRIIVGNTNRALTDWLHSVFGGTLQVRHQLKIRHNKDCYLWTLTTTKQMQEFLVAVQPHLKLKKDQAQLLLSLLSQHNVSDPKFREETYQKMRELNQKGKPVTTKTSDTTKRYQVVKIESELRGDAQSESAVTQMAA
jgi:hypothetical protein